MLIQKVIYVVFITFQDKKKCWRIYAALKSSRASAPPPLLSSAPPTPLASLTKSFPSLAAHRVSDTKLVLTVIVVTRGDGHHGVPRMSAVASEPCASPGFSGTLVCDSSDVTSVKAAGALIMKGYPKVDCFIINQRGSYELRKVSRCSLEPAWSLIDGICWQSASSRA